MMLLISYDLNKPGQDYSRLYDEIKKAGTWWHHLDSTWIISTSSGPEEWERRLRRHMDDNDSLLVIEICDNYQGWLPQKAWEWLEKRDFRRSMHVANFSNRSQKHLQ